MNKEKQIEEMASEIFDKSPIACLWRSEAERLAQHLYNAGYRKQSEGEWIDLYKGKYANPLYVCSVCEKGTLLRVEGNELGQPETVQALSSFCPSCGAKMKGGVE